MFKKKRIAKSIELKMLNEDEKERLRNCCKKLGQWIDEESVIKLLKNWKNFSEKCAKIQKKWEEYEKKTFILAQEG